MIDGQLDFALPCRVIQIRGKKALRLEEMRLPHDVFIDLYRLCRDACLSHLLNQELLLRGRHIQTRLWTEMIGEELEIVINDEPLNHFSPESARLFVYLLLVGVEIPETAANQNEQND